MNAELAGQLIDELRAQGVTVVAIGDKLRIKALRGVVTDVLRDRILEHKPALMLALRSRPATSDAQYVENTRTSAGVHCFACRGRRFWISVSGVTICAICHPPAAQRLVAAWIGAE